MSLWVVTLLIMSESSSLTHASSPIQILDSATASSVDGATNLPVNRTQLFSAGDASVYSWIELGSVPSPSHIVTWIWIDSSSTQYSKWSFTVPDPGQGKTWGQYFAWLSISVAGHQAAQMRGTWEIDIYIDGNFATFQQFTIAPSAVAIQPTERFSWPFYNIPVYLGSSSAQVRIDVEKAMTQWNYSQVWFQTKYGLHSQPVFSLVLSNDASGPIRVSFNQTQSSPNWGWTSYHYFYNSSGMFTSVTCAISIVLTLSDGTPLNDVAMQDIAEHELGHCLGLWHTVQSGDVMNHYGGSFTASRYPSTLNLYALYQLAQAHRVDQVASYYALPASIGYALSPGSTTNTTTTTTTSGPSSTTVAANYMNSTSATSRGTSASSLSTSSEETSAMFTLSSMNTTASGIDILEFSYWLVAVSIFSVIIIVSYLVLRRRV